MNPKLNEYSEEESRMINGQTVMTVLSDLGDAATADKISDEIVFLSNQPKEVIEPEVKRILRRGVSNGFLVRFGRNYLLSGDHKAVEVDSKRNSYKNIGKRNKRKRNIKSVENSTERGEEDHLRVTRNIALKLEETDSVRQSNQLVLLNPKEVVNGIISDLYNLVNPSEETSKEQDEQDNVIDLEAVITNNLNNFSEPFNRMTEME